MKALKGLLIYVGIVLAMILGIGIILFAVMYFVPTFRIMGVGVVHERGVKNRTEVVLSEFSGYDSIELNVSSKRVNLQIGTSEKAENIEYSLALNNFGIAFDIVEYKVVKSAEVKDSTLKINLNITEPEGWISDTSSYFRLSLPSSKKYDLILKTTDGNINLDGNDSKLKLNKLAITTGKGSFYSNGLGQVVDGKTNLILDSLNLTTGIGKINFNKVDNLTVKSPIKLTSTIGTFNFKNVNGAFNITGTGVNLNVDLINTNIDGFKFISENGLLNIGKLVTPAGAENTIVTENCDVKIGEITGQTAIINNLGNINIGTINDSIVLESTHGNVNVTLAKEDIRVETDFGNITVNSYLRNAKFISRKGNIDVKSTGDYVQGVYTQIENEDGKIVVDNKINRLLITTTGSSKVEITYREIKGGLEDPSHVFQHKVNLSAYSSAVVYMPTANYNTPFKFKAKGNISGEISGLTTEYEGAEVKSSDDFQFFPSASEESQSECRKSCYFEFYGTIVFKGYINR